MRGGGLDGGVKSKKILQFDGQGSLDLLIASGQDCHLAAILLEGASEHFNDRGFARAANCQIANADDLTAESFGPDQAVFKERQAHVHDEAVETR